MPVENIKSRKFIKLLIFLPVLIFSLFTFITISKPANAQNVPNGSYAISRPCNWTNSTDLSGSTGNALDMSFNADVNCRCAKNELFKKRSVGTI